MIVIWGITVGKLCLFYGGLKTDVALREGHKYRVFYKTAHRKLLA